MHRYGATVPAHDHVIVLIVKGDSATDIGANTFAIEFRPDSAAAKILRASR